MGMGRAFVALSGDASAPFWNPAATASLDRSEFTAFHTTLFLDTQYDCFSLSYPMDRIGAFSLSAARLGSDNIERRDIYNIQTGTFSSAETQFGLAYARRIAFGLSGGLTLKAANQRIGDVSGTGFGADLGMRYESSFVTGLSLGLAFNDLISPAVKLENSEDKYKTLSRFGASYSRPFGTKVASETSLELGILPGRSAKFHGGIDLQFYRQFSVRAGIDRGRVSFGAGMIYRFVKIDYAFENVAYLGGSHRISLGFVFGKSLAETRRATREKIIREEKESWLNSLETERQAAAGTNLARADSLRDAGLYQRALGYYQRALVLDSSRTEARIMSDSMIALVTDQAVQAAGDRKRSELIAGRIGSAMSDFQNGNYNESISKLNLMLEIDPGNKSVADLLATVKETLKKEIADQVRTAKSSSASGDYVGALAAWNRVLALDKNNPQAAGRIDELKGQIKADQLVADAVTAINERRYKSAVSSLEQARKIRPDDRTIQSLMLEARAKSAPPTTLEDIRASQSGWESYLSGLESYQSGDYAEALRIWEELRNSYPNNSELDNNIDQARQRLSAGGGR